MTALCNCTTIKGSTLCLVCGGAPKPPKDRAGTAPIFKVCKRQLGEPSAPASHPGPVPSSAGPSRSSNPEVGSPNTRALQKVMTTMTSAQRKQALASWIAQLDAVASVEAASSTTPPTKLLTSEAERAMQLMSPSSRSDLRERSARLVPMLAGNNTADTGEYFESAMLAVSVINFIDELPRPLLLPLAAAPSPASRVFNRNPENCTTFEMFEDILGPDLAVHNDTKEGWSKKLAEKGLDTAMRMIAYLQLEATGRDRAGRLERMFSTGDASLVVTSLARFF